VALVHPIVTGWANYCRHTNASQAFRGLQRFVNIRFRRYLTQRSKGRGLGWKRFPNSKLYDMGLVYIGSGRLKYVAKPVHGGR
jgi:hypothetical protein